MPALRSLAALALAALAACAPPSQPAAAPRAEAPKRVRIVHTNDFHGRLAPQAPAWAGGRAVGGSAVLAAHFDSAAARFDGPTLVLSAGDDLQGTAVSNLSWGRATIASHNAAGYDAAALGNHEFDWGQDTLQARVAESRFPWLAANLRLAGTDRPPPWTRGWVMVERGGVRTAVIGIALPETPQMVMAGRVDGLEFGPPAPAIDRAAREARAAGADFVVVTMHVGAECERPGEAPAEPSSGCTGDALEVAEALGERVDLVLAGHTHRRVLAEAGGVPVAEAEWAGTRYTLTDLELRGGRAVAVRREVRAAWAHEVDPDTQVARVVGEWEERVRPIAGREVVRFAAEMPRTANERGEYPLGNLVADAQRVAAGAQAALVNNSSIRRGMPAGPVTYGMLYELQPFQNQLIALEVTGAQLRAALENGIAGTGEPDAHLAGMTVRYDPAAPRGSRVRGIRLDDGREVADDTQLTLAVSEFMARGGDRYVSLTEAAPRPTGILDLDALIRHLASLPQPVRPPATGRWVPVR